MAGPPRGKAPRPAKSADDEATIFAAAIPKPPPKKGTDSQPAPAPSPASIPPPNPDAAPLADEGTMMMVGPATGPPPPGANPNAPKPGLAGTMMMNMSGANPALGLPPGANPAASPNAALKNSQPPPAYGPPLNATAYMQQRPPMQAPMPQPQQGPKPMGMPQGGMAPPQGAMQPRPGQGPMGMQMPQTGPQMAPPAQAQNFRAPPPPPAAPGIQLPPAPDARLILVNEPESARATSFRVLRDNLLAKRLPRILAVSSAMKGDGKTTCALNLGLSLSEGARVLVVDGNLLDPTLHKIFRIDESTVPSAVNGPWAQPYKICEYSPSLSIAAVVTPPGAQAPRFERRWFDGFLASVRRMHYDFVLLDTAALSAAPTVSQMVASADATIMAVRAGVTTARALRRASEQIPEGRALGVALIDAKSA